MTLSKAIQIASKAHHGESDTAIMHPLRVMIALHRDGWQETVLIAGVLHDTLEDTNVTVDSLVRAGFAHDVIVALEHLTRRKNEEYFAYIERLRGNWIAKVVKLADLRDNLDRDPPESLRHRYLKALGILT